MAHRLLLLAALISCSGAVAAEGAEKPIEISGRYPHLAVFNHGGECGIGAVVPWAGRLWLITYSPHKPHGSDDKLYEVDEALNLSARPESIGGTPANRLIHRESKQLFIGPYVIDSKGKVRVIPYTVATGRPTASLRHLTDPAGKVYTFTMEEGLYEIDVKTLEVTTLMKDGHSKGFKDILPGYHGKGAYSGQGRIVVANNGGRGMKWHEQLFGDTGCLAQWRGPGHEWEVLMQHQFTDVTGPGGIEGNASLDDPLWAIGWDRRSLRLELLDGGRWATYRVPVSDQSYFASHGWYTEWPRIREVVPVSGASAAKLLMNLHGGWFDFPKGFRTGQTGGLRPIGSYLKISGDFTPWKGRIVFACDDTAITGGNKLAGQSQSNLWFTSFEGLHQAGAPVGWGGPWRDDKVEADVPSDPYLLAGYNKRSLHLAHKADRAVRFALEIDADGSGTWKKQDEIEVPAGGYVWKPLDDGLAGQWIRLRSDADADGVTARFHYGLSRGAETDAEMFAGLAEAEQPAVHSTGIVRPRGGDLGTLHMVAQTIGGDGKVTGTGYYEMDADMKLVHRPDDADAKKYLEEKASIQSPDFKVDAASVVMTDRGKRYRLPKSSAVYDNKWAGGWPRGIREVATERDLLNAHGTFYLLPKRDYSAGVRGIKPVATHNRRIGDFCTWRGLLVLTGGKLDAPDSPHRIVAEDGQAAVWVGDVDDLWKLGKPVGTGGPWLATKVKAGEPSDAYLMTGYDRKRLTLLHDSDAPVTFTIEVDCTADGTWHRYEQITVPPGKTVEHEFPAGYSAHWARLTPDAACTATATFRYE